MKKKPKHNFVNSLNMVAPYVCGAFQGKSLQTSIIQFKQMLNVMKYFVTLILFIANTPLFY